MAARKVEMKGVSIGMLGCGRVGEYGLIEPARAGAGLIVHAVASRDLAKARAYADRHGVLHIHSYETLIADPDIEAIYIALPNAMHAEWSERALLAGKAVLCEKPLTSNAGEAFANAETARRTGLPFVEAVHWRYHPLAARLAEICQSGALGEITDVSVKFLYAESLLLPGDIRRDYAQGGGVTMDTGHYCLSLLRLLLGEPSRLVSAKATKISPDIDIIMKGEFEFSGGRYGRFVTGSCLSEANAVETGAVISGTAGKVTVPNNVFTPQWGAEILFEAEGRSHREPVDPTPTYFYQAVDFAKVVRTGSRPLTSGADGIATMAMIDAVYIAAGMRVRGQ